jgi:hypothetical protein
LDCGLIRAGKVEYDAAVAIATIKAYIKAADIAIRKTIAEAGLTGTAREDLRQFATDKVAADILFLVSWTLSCIARRQNRQSRMSGFARAET